MSVPERFIKQYGTLERVPSYIRDHYEKRDQLEKEREEKIQEAKRKKEREWDRIKALRRPPTNVRLEGRRIYFEPPETANELEFAGFWVSEEYKGNWTKHGDYLLPHVRSAVLFGEGPAYVETWYHQMALGEMYRSPIVGLPAPKLSRMDIIRKAVETFKGRRTKDGRPYLRYLRKHAGISDITSSERDEAYRSFQE